MIERTKKIEITYLIEQREGKPKISWNDFDLENLLSDFSYKKDIDSNGRERLMVYLYSLKEYDEFVCRFKNYKTRSENGFIYREDTRIICSGREWIEILF